MATVTNFLKWIIHVDSFWLKRYHFLLLRDRLSEITQFVNHSPLPQGESGKILKGQCHKTKNKRNILLASIHKKKKRHTARIVQTEIVFVGTNQCLWFNRSGCQWRCLADDHTIMECLLLASLTQQQSCVNKNQFPLAPPLSNLPVTGQSLATLQGSCAP